MDDIRKKSLAYQKMEARYKLPKTLRGGTEAMREAGKDLLPQFPKEEDEAYRKRLEQSFLLEAYPDSIDRLVSRPFQRPISIQAEDELPDYLQALRKNADGSGKSLTAFARDLFDTGVDQGMAIIFVDVAMKDGQARPYFVEINPDRIVKVGATKTASGAKKLSWIRWIEKSTTETPDGEVEVEYVREWTTRDWAMWKCTKEGDEPVLFNGEHRIPHTFGKMRDQATGELMLFATDEKGNHILEDDGSLILDPAGGTPSNGMIPLVPVYTCQTGFLTAKPPLLRLAWENLRHWQIRSDVDKYARFARIGGHFFSGMSAEEFKKMGSSWGAGFMGHAKSETANHQAIEAQGTAYEIGRQQLLDSESTMRNLGNQPLMERLEGPEETAEGKRTNEARAASDLHMWVHRNNSAFETAFLYAAIWRDDAQSIPETFGVKIFDDFQAMSGSSKGLELMIAARSGPRPLFSDQTIIGRFQDVGYIPDTLVPEEEFARVSDEQNKINLGEQ